MKKDSSLVGAKPVASIDEGNRNTPVISGHHTCY